MLLLLLLLLPADADAWWDGWRRQDRRAAYDRCAPLPPALDPQPVLSAPAAAGVTDGWHPLLARDCSGLGADDSGG
eukprot:COSAG01_NODE_23993_length_793_cov_2.271942_1_plen_75_part_10